MSATCPDLDKLSLLKMTLNEKLATLNKLDSEIVEFTGEKDLEDEIKQADEYTEGIYEGLTHINNTLAAAAAAPSMLYVPPVPATTPSTSTIGKVKLPRITLPHFNGSLLKWHRFGTLLSLLSTRTRISVMWTNSIISDHY